MYIDLLTKIRNAQGAKKESLKSSYSKMDEQILNILVQENYLDGIETKGRSPKKTFDIKLKYDGKKGVINGIKFLSRPSRRIYIGYENLRPVKHGYGLLLISTSKGVMTGKEAKKMKIGGEMLFQIW